MATARATLMRSLYVMPLPSAVQAACSTPKAHRIALHDVSITTLNCSCTCKAVLSIYYRFCRALASLRFYLRVVKHFMLAGGKLLWRGMSPIFE